MKKVSVIVPVYNVGQCVVKAANSLLNQTLRDFEIIFINDCSTDESYNVLVNIAQSNKRDDIAIKIIQHQVNMGVAVARNTGLDNAVGEFIYYVDADDYCDADTLEVMYQEAITKQCDVVGCEWLLTFENNARHMVQPEVKSCQEAFVKMCNGVMRWNLWLFMVRRSIYEEHQFRFIPKANMGEDMMVMMKILLSTNAISIIHRPLYHYIQTNSNAMTKNFSAYQHQVTDNVSELERYVRDNHYNEYLERLLQLKLTLKLPLLISDKESDYEMWQSWFSESNDFVGKNEDQPLRTVLIQKAAVARLYFVLKLYYRLVIKFMYGIIYK